MDRLAGIRTKIKRARSHIQDFERARTNFFAHDPYVVGTKRNSQTRQLIYYLVSIEEVPPLLSVIAGDAIQNLRTALDYLACQLVMVGRGISEPPDRVYFPIFDSAKEYEAGKLGRIKGARKDAIEAIDSVKPYKGGNDLLWQIHRLNILDKHRLMLTVGSYFHSFDIGAHMKAYMEPMIRRTFPDQEFPTLSAFLRPADTMCPLKAGDELFIDRPDAEPDKDMKFAFDIALSEPQIIESESLLETLNNMANLVEGLIPPFESFLS